MLRHFEGPAEVSEAAPKAIGEFNTRCCQADDVDYDVPYPNTFKIKTFFGGLLMHADTPEEREKWVDTLREVGNPADIRVLPAPPASNKRASLSLSPPASLEKAAVPSPLQSVQQVQAVQPMLSLSPPASSEKNTVRSKPSPVQPVALENAVHNETSQVRPAQPVEVVQAVQQVKHVESVQRERAVHQTQEAPTRASPPVVQQATAATSPAAPATIPASPPQSLDAYVQLQRKFEATRRALADHVTKCRDLEVSATCLAVFT